MYYYHGTTNKAARMIQESGLQPHRETAYQMMTDDFWNFRSLPGEEEQVIYVTPRKEWAKRYALFRTRYERAKDGDVIPFAQTKFIKDTDRRDADVTPVVITFDVPEDMVPKFQQDRQSIEGRVCKCTLEPKFIKSVEPINSHSI